MFQNALLSLGLAVACLMTSPAIAQKMDWERFTAQYTRLPTDPLPAEFTTYTKRAYGPSSQMTAASLTTGDLLKMIQMDGYKLAQNGHFRIVFRIGYMRFKGYRTNTIERETEKDGKKTKYYRYNKTFQYSMPLSVEITDYKGNVIEKREILGNKSSTWKSEEYSSRSTLNTWFAKNRASIQNKLFAGTVRTHMKSAMDEIRKKYDYEQITNYTDWMERVRKFDEEEEFNNHLEACFDAFKEMSPVEPVDELRKTLEPAIAYWTSLMEKYDADHRKERRVVHACAYNTAVAYYWLDDMANATKYADECLKVGWKESRPRQLKKEIEATLKLFEANDVTTRHIQPDLENAEPPSDAPTLADEEDVEEEVVTLDGYILTGKKDSLPGKFLVNTGEDEVLAFGPEGNVIFEYESEGDEKKHMLDPSGILKFSIGDREFSVLEFAPGADPDAKKKPCIMEHLYQSNRINVLAYCPYDDKLGDEDSELALQKSGGELVSLKDTQFLIFHSGLAKYFEDCEDLKGLAENKEFERNEKDIVRAARVYAEVCK